MRTLMRRPQRYLKNVLVMYFSRFDAGYRNDVVPNLRDKLGQTLNGRGSGTGNKQIEHVH